MENFLKETIQSSLSDEGYQRSLSQAIDDRIRAHLADKDRQIQLIEKEIISIKQREQYFSNGSSQ